MLLQVFSSVLFLAMLLFNITFRLKSGVCMRCVCVCVLTSVSCMKVKLGLLLCVGDLRY